MKKILCTLAIVSSIVLSQSPAFADIPLSQNFQRQVLDIKNQYKIKKNTLESTYDAEKQTIQYKMKQLELDIVGYTKATKPNVTAIKTALSEHQKHKIHLMNLKEKYQMSRIAMDKELAKKVSSIQDAWANSIKK